LLSMTLPPQGGRFFLQKNPLVKQSYPLCPEDIV
jgi:hypothetical protein